MSQDFGSVAADLRTINTHAVASVAWLAWDICISFGDEVDLIWNSANTPPKFLYFFSRYFGFLLQLTLGSFIFPIGCKEYLVWSGVAVVLLTFSVESSLVVRIYALYGKSREMFYLLGGTFALEIIATIVLGTLAYQRTVPYVSPFPDDWPTQGCFSPSIPSFYKPSWAPVLIFETFLFVLSTYRCLAFRPLNEVPLLQRIVRDGSIYYFVVFAGLVACVAGSYLGEHEVYDLANLWLPAIFSFAGSRLLLSVRRLAADRDRLLHLQVLTPIPSSALPPVGGYPPRPPSPRPPALPSPSHSWCPATPVPTLARTPSLTTLRVRLSVEGADEAPRTPQDGVGLLRRPLGVCPDAHAGCSENPGALGWLHEWDP